MAVEWSPAKHLMTGASTSSTPSALLVLNQPIIDIPCFRRLWENCTYRMCADGGANRLFELFAELDNVSSHPHMTREEYLPNEICGDLDSLRPDVQQYYNAHKVKITHDPDQESTDLMKCLRRIHLVMTRDGEAATKSQSPGPSFDVVVLGGLAGRVDQGFSIIHHLYAAVIAPSRVGLEDAVACKIYLYSELSISVVLDQGQNTIHTSRAQGLLEENVGILPVGKPAVISTKGLEWDVENWKTEFGHRISTSNHIRSDVVEVSTDVPVLFTVERSKVSS